MLLIMVYWLEIGFDQNCYNFIVWLDTSGVLFGCNSGYVQYWVIWSVSYYCRRSAQYLIPMF